MRITRIAILLFAFSFPAGAQTTLVNGRYFFRQLQFTTDTQGNVTGTTGALGSLDFNSSGQFTVDATQTIGNLQPSPLTGTGIYTIQPSGVMALSNPQRNGLTINARIGTEAILGSTTESGDNTFDVFAAIPAPANGQGASLFQGTYSMVSFELRGGVTDGARSALFSLPVIGSGIIANFLATGHAAALQNGALVTQTVSGASYAVGADGIGSISFGNSALLSGTRNLYVSRSGNVVLSGSPYAGGQDFLIGVRQFAGSPAISNLSGLYWTAGLRIDLKHLSTEAYVGAFNGIPALAETVTADRLHQIGILSEDVTLSNPLTLNSDNTFGYNLDLLSLGTGGGSFVAAGLNQADTNGYSIDIGILAPAVSGTGVFLNPQGILNAASLAPIGTSVAPGEFVSLFGTGLAAAAISAPPPYPTVLGNVSVSVNNIAAPIAYASPTQLNILIPYGVTSSAAAVIVTNGQAISNTVVVPLQRTAPGVFSVTGSGTGLGAITHANGGSVSVASPAQRGETVIVYATGLGVVTPAAIDGVPASGTTVNQVAVTIAGQPASVSFAGLSPSFPGLYQINVGIPANLVGTGALPLAIQTVDAFHDQVDLQVR